MNKTLLPTTSTAGDSDAFAAYHPLVSFVYFLTVLLFSMFLMHPVCLALSLAAALAYSLRLNGRRALRFNLRYMLPLMLLTALLNPIFNHQGTTVLFYLAAGKPLTLESILYGLAAAAMLVAVIGWFSCYNAVMSSDKFIYLFGRVIPALSLLFSMVLRFVPRFKAQLQTVAAAQRCLGLDTSSGTLRRRARHAISIISIMTTWALENAVETADSMKARGYGLPGRTAFSIYHFSRRDRRLLLLMLALALYVLIGALTGGLGFSYFPAMRYAPLTPYSISVFIAYPLLLALPLIIDCKEDTRWKALAANSKSAA